MWNEQRESMSRAELNDLQLVYLRSLVSRIESNVPFYSEALKKAGLSSEKIRSLGDLSHLPFTSKSDLRNQYPRGMVAVPQIELRRFHASSGTRGKPTVVAYTQADLANWAELVARCLFAVGVRPGDTVHNAYGYGLFTGGLGMHAGIEQLGAIAVPASGGKSHQQVTLLKDLGARALCCTPSYAMKLSSTLSEMGVDITELNLEIGIFGAEPWTNQLGQSVQDSLKMRAFDIYGLSEVMGPGVSIQCEAVQTLDDKRLLHIWEDHFLAEIIDPKTLEILPEGEEGELVITTLQKEGIPLLRFRTGDISRLIKEPCSCGRTHARMSSVRARFDDMLIVRGVNVYPTEIERIVFQFPTHAGQHYQILLKRNGSLDEITVQIEAPPEGMDIEISEFSGDDWMNSYRAHLTNTFEKELGLSVAVEMIDFNSIERSDGKGKRVLDMRSSESGDPGTAGGAPQDFSPAPHASK